MFARLAITINDSSLTSCLQLKQSITWALKRSQIWLSRYYSSFTTIL